MRTLVLALGAVLTLGAACGGDESLGSTEQATLDEYPLMERPYVVALYNSFGIIGNGLLINYENDVLYSSFHEGWDHWQAQKYAFQTEEGYGEPVFNLYCSEFQAGVWKVCETAWYGKTYYGATFTQRTPTFSLKALGAGTVCNANTMAPPNHPTNPTNWVVQDGPAQGSTPEIRVADLSGFGNYGSNNLCSPMGMEDYCYDYDTGSTCMWGDDGSIQLYYGNWLVGLGFGNMGAAWLNSTVASWLNQVR